MSHKQSLQHLPHVLKSAAHGHASFAPLPKRYYQLPKAYKTL